MTYTFHLSLGSVFLGKIVITLSSDPEERHDKVTDVTLSNGRDYQGLLTSEV